MQLQRFEFDEIGKRTEVGDLVVVECELGKRFEPGEDGDIGDLIAGDLEFGERVNGA